MLIGQEKVIEYIKLTGARHFRIYQGNNKKTPVFTYQEAGGPTAAQNYFSQWAALNNSPQAVEYYMTLYPKGMPKTNLSAEEEGGSVRDTLCTYFYLVNPDPFSRPGQAPPSQYGQQFPAPVMGAAPTGETREQMAARMRAEIEQEYELDEMQEEIDTLKASQVEFMGTVNKFMGYLGPVIQGFLQGSAPAPIPRATHLAGEPTVEAPRVVDTENFVRVNAALKTLRKNDPNITAHLEKLAIISEAKPAIFAQFLYMLDTDAI
jgi:hypothetical protein